MPVNSSLLEDGARRKQKEGKRDEVKERIPHPPLSPLCHFNLS